MLLGTVQAVSFSADTAHGRFPPPWSIEELDALSCERQGNSQTMSALPPKADIVRDGCDVRCQTRISNRVAFGNLFAPSGESIGESTVPRRTFFECKNGTTAIVVNDRNIKPGPVFEQLHVTLHIGVDR